MPTTNTYKTGRKKCNGVKYLQQGRTGGCVNMHESLVVTLALLVLLHEVVRPVADVEVRENQPQLGEGKQKV